MTVAVRRQRCKRTRCGGTSERGAFARDKDENSRMFGSFRLREGFSSREGEGGMPPFPSVFCDGGRAGCCRQSFQRGEKELFVGGFAFVLVQRLAEFSVKDVHVASEPRRRYGVLDVLFHACRAHAELLGEQTVAVIFQRHHLFALLGESNEPREQAVAFEIGLETQSQQI